LFKALGWRSVPKRPVDACLLVPLELPVTELEVELFVLSPSLVRESIKTEKFVPSPKLGTGVAVT
jgi:hypothetical protein